MKVEMTNSTSATGANDNKQPVLLLIRGVPGSGKSTMAKEMKSAHGFAHFEADMYLTAEGGEYWYHPGRVAAAHLWCHNQARNALALGVSVVVSNTFTRNQEMAPYFALAKEQGAEIRVIEATGSWKNVHGVPAEIIQAMRKRWEPLDLRLAA